MKNTTLVVLAAGIGSRFGGGIKQLTPVGPAGEIIMDYSIHDALEAGFNDIVFIIRHDLENDFRSIIGNRIEKICPVRYAFQELSALPAGYRPNPDRKKPYGTGHALLCCKGLIHNPFVIINADDYYGKEGFRLVHDFLVSHDGEDELCMAGFILGNTLSDNGGVTRGVCRVDGNGYLTGVTETSNLVRTKDGAAVAAPDGTLTPIDARSNVSMNMWGMTPMVIDALEEKFPRFLDTLAPDNIKAEFLLPTVVDELIRERRASVRVLPTEDHWFGVTYAEDKQSVIDSFADLVRRGVYRPGLF